MLDCIILCHEAIEGGGGASTDSRPGFVIGWGVVYKGVSG